MRMKLVLTYHLSCKCLSYIGQGSILHFSSLYTIFWGYIARYLSHFITGVGVKDENIEYILQFDK